MTNDHRISPEPDRKAFQYLQNIKRLHNHQQQLERLERMKVSLAHVMLERHHAADVNIKAFIHAVNAGDFALESGKSFEDAVEFAEERFRTLSEAAEQGAG